MKPQHSTHEEEKKRGIAAINLELSHLLTSEAPTVSCRRSHSWKRFLAILNPLRRLLDIPVRAHRIHMGTGPQEEHPGWNIVDEVELVAHGECRYLVELVSRQPVTVSLASRVPVGLVVLDDDEYESRENDQSWSGSCSATSRDLGDRDTNNPVTFNAARTGPYDVIVTNRGDRCARVVVRITAAPAGRVVPKGPLTETSGAGSVPPRGARATWSHG
jgi:hypothetical protein